jgi:4-hydroxybenzoyl-CoA reductase subunit alpha
MSAAGPRRAGTATPLIDGVEKVSGRARFTADFHLREALAGRILRSPLAHGHIRAIDTARELLG